MSWVLLRQTTNSTKTICNHSSIILATEFICSIAFDRISNWHRVTNFEVFTYVKNI